MSQVVFILPDYEGMSRVELPHSPGKRLQRYLHELKESGRRGVIQLIQSCRITNQRREPLRMSYVPEPDDVILFQPVSSMS